MAVAAIMGWADRGSSFVFGLGLVSSPSSKPGKSAVTPGAAQSRL